MKKKGLLALLLTFIMLFSSVGTVFAEGEGSAQVPAWTAADFTYGEEAFELYPASEIGKKLNVNAWVIKGLSEAGIEKIAVNKDMVIPATDPDGKQVQGIGKNALKGQGITSLVLPEGVKTSYDDTTWETTGKGLTQRGNFFVGYGAFQNNSLVTLDLPDGVIYVGSYAFQGNQLVSVQLPKSLMWVASASFAKNSISKVEFPDATDFAFQADMQAFAINQIKMVKLPSNTEKLNKYVFFQNTGMEAITNGNANEKKGGLVYMYMNAENPGPYMDYKSANSSNVQELFLGEFWTVNDFTYDDAGTTVTGLSDIGKVKLTIESEIKIPAVGPTEQPITTIGDGTNMQGIFVVADDAGTADDTSDDKYYTPSSVILPSTLTKIGKWSFALNAGLTYETEMNSITLPEGLVEIGQTAFQNSKLTSVSIPDSVTTMGTGAFTGSEKLASVKLSKNVISIPQSAFNAGTAKNMSLKTVVIPEGVQVVGRQAFTGAHIENLTLPSTLTEIGQQAFENHQLTEVTIPGSVKTIGKYAFRINQASLVKALTKVVLNEGLETIGQEAFLGNKITEIVLPSTVVLSAKDKAADCIFGNKNNPADPIVKVLVSDAAKAEACNTKFANDYSHVLITGYWVKDDIGSRYKNGDGNWVKSDWKLLDGIWYYFDATGYMETGWVFTYNTWYYLDENGAMVTGWKKVNNVWYYFDATGAMQTGWVLDGSTWYYMDVTGAMQTGWVYSGDTWYYLGGNGAMAANRWLAIGNEWYYFDGNGAMRTGWVLVNGTWYYMDGSGAMQTGWLLSGNTWYYLENSGAMAANKWIGNYYVDASGAWIP